MAEETRDTLMRMVIGNNPIAAEAQALIAGDDTLAADFRKTKVATNAFTGSYFAVKDFRLEVGLLPDTLPNEAEEGQARREQDDIFRMQIEFLMSAQRNAATGKPPMAGHSFNQFPRFMTFGASSIRGKPFSTDLEPVQFSKLMDKSSIELFKACVNFTVFDSATIIKRRGMGSDLLYTYLQITFTDVLIIDFDWQDDDVVKENVKFVCREAKVKYAMPKDDGSLDASLPPQSWSLLNQS
jgi:type VI protein secretion system component Hcp